LLAWKAGTVDDARDRAHGRDVEVLAHDFAEGGWLTAPILGAAGRGDRPQPDVKCAPFIAEEIPKSSGERGAPICGHAVADRPTTGYQHHTGVPARGAGEIGHIVGNDGECRRWQYLAHDGRDDRVLVAACWCSGQPQPDRGDLSRVGTGGTQGRLHRAVNGAAIALDAIRPMKVIGGAALAGAEHRTVQAGHQRLRRRLSTVDGYEQWLRHELKPQQRIHSHGSNLQEG
jgi:hypothetical protein